MKQKKLLFIGIASIILVAGVVFLVTQNRRDNSDYFCYPSPMKCKNPTLRHVEQPKYKEASSYSVAGTGGYECSRSIKLVSNTTDKDGDYVAFNPVDESEAMLFCHMTYAEEYKGKIKVLQKPEVLNLIGKYQYKDVSIKALEFKYIQDKDFVHRLLPAYKDKEIGCIILLDTPGEDKVYLEDEELETFEELDYHTFAQYLEQVSPADRQLFYDNLK